MVGRTWQWASCASVALVVQTHNPANSPWTPTSLANWKQPFPDALRHLKDTSFPMKPLAGFQEGNGTVRGTPNPYNSNSITSLSMGVGEGASYVEFHPDPSLVGVGAMPFVPSHKQHRISPPPRDEARDRLASKTRTGTDWASLT